MSEMGHLRRFGDVRGMSALMRFADLTQSACDVPQVPAADICSAAKCTLFDDLIGATEQRERHREAKRRCGFEIDDELDLGGLLDR
jgi:hypothetical protein